MTCFEQVFHVISPSITNAVHASVVLTRLSVCIAAPKLNSIRLFRGATGNSYRWLARGTGRCGSFWAVLNARSNRELSMNATHQLLRLNVIMRAASTTLTLTSAHVVQRWRSYASSNENGPRSGTSTPVRYRNWLNRCCLESQKASAETWGMTSFSNRVTDRSSRRRLRYRNRYALLTQRNSRRLRSDRRKALPTGWRSVPSSISVCSVISTPASFTRE